MAVTRTASGLSYADLGDPALSIMNENVQRAAAYLGPLAVDYAEVPSASLNVKVAAGAFRAPWGGRVAYAGAASVAVPASSTTYLWLDVAGTLQQGPAYPSGVAIVRLARVDSDGTTVTAIADNREPLAAVGAPASLPAGAAQQALTDSTGGSLANYTLASGAASSSVNNDNIAKLARAVNEMRAVLVNAGLMKGSA